MKFVLAVLAFVMAVPFVSLLSTAEAQTKAKAATKSFEAPGSLMAPKGTVQGRMAEGGLSATCTSTDGKATCTCAICWVTSTSCGCTEAPAAQEGIKSGAIKFREQRTK